MFPQLGIGIIATGSAFLGPLFEGLVASEIVKAQINRGKRREIYYFRDQQGLEVDFIVPSGSGRLAFIEAKASQTLRPEMAGPILRLRASATDRQVDCFVVCPGAGAPDSFVASGGRDVFRRDASTVEAERLNQLFATCKANAVLGLTGHEPTLRQALQRAWPAANGGT